MAHEKIVTDEHLSDHQWRLKMADEGKALYIPGKTIEQVKAERKAAEEQAASLSARTIAMTGYDWDVLSTAIPDVVEVLHDLRNLLEMSALADFIGISKSQTASMMRLAARAVGSMENREIEALDRLDHTIRHAIDGGQ